MIYFYAGPGKFADLCDPIGDRGDREGAGVLPAISWQMVCVLAHRSSPSEKTILPEIFKVSSTEEFIASVVIPSLPGSNTFHYPVDCLWSEAFPGIYRGL